MTAPDSQDAIAEIRQAELKRSRKKQLVIGSGASLLLIVAIAAVIATVYSDSKDPDSSPTSGPGPVRTSSKSVEMVCTSTDYKHTCESSLSKAVKSENPDPKEIVRAAVSAIFDEIGAAFNHTQNVKTNDTRLTGAIADCRQLFIDSKDELKTSLDVIVDKGIDHFPDRAHDIRTWLSAVMSYQHTCIDGFPEGDLKKKLNEGMEETRELTSNALAIVGKVAKFLAMMNVEGVISRRRLLVEEEEEEEEVVGPDEMPAWMPEGERRDLKEVLSMKPKPNVTVAKDGSGQFKTISSALAHMPKNNKGRYVIYVKPGVYDETVIVTSQMKNVTIYGDDPANTIVTGNKNYIDGTRTFQTATFAAVGEGFMAMRMTFRNTAGAIKHQAVALRVQSDRSVFLNCNMEGYQDTLYAQTHRQFYRACVISGTIDFIFGDAAAVFQNCVIVVRRPLDNQQNIVTAQGRTDHHESTGFVIQRCKIVADPALKPDVKKFRSYLGRPWKEFSRTLIMETEIGDLISPEGYMPWEGQFGLKTLAYAEYHNSGPGSEFKDRVKWHGVRQITKEDAEPFTLANFIQAGDWIKKFGVPVPVRMGFYN